MYRRVEVAKALLQVGIDLSLAQGATHAGFSDRSNAPLKARNARLEALAHAAK